MTSHPEENKTEAVRSTHRITEIGDPKDHTTAIEIRIVRTNVHESILALGHRHHIDPDRWRPLIMNFLEFYGLGSQVHPSRLARRVLTGSGNSPARQP
ncbi:MAG: hypothetical protein DRJ28_02485 [Actinobacteria bacterium]|nr:MAG: hypothetical protein DRJ28_02485 [Actinomycetota bacterium]